MRDQVLKVRHLVESDLRRVLAGPDPPNSARLLLGKVAALPGGDPHEARRMLTTFLDSPKTSPTSSGPRPTACGPTCTAPPSRRWPTSTGLLNSTPRTPPTA